MKTQNKLPELLAPAGDLKALYAAVMAGADAVYLGAKSFGARAFAKNFDKEELSRAVEYCHLHGVKLYVTVNTLVYDREMKELSELISELYIMGVDAIITADLGVIDIARKICPELPIHASTQMSVHNTPGAEIAARLGCERVVLARELSLENIKSVTEHASVETEVFLHGALCVCHSGQCLMSSLIGGRSGNRGECAQPCRLPYNSGKYPLSLSDLCLAEHIPELIESGTASLKIEGRMKSAEYVYTVTSIYRRLLDEARRATKSELLELKSAFSRGKFTDGYFTDKKFSKMLGVRSEEDKELSRAIQETEFGPITVSVKAIASFKLSEPSRLTLIKGDKRVTVFGPAPVPAINAPLTEEDVKARLCKMGGTPLSLLPDDIELSLDVGINLPLSAQNALRRDAVTALLDTKRCAESSAEYKAEDSKKKESPLKTALFLKGALYDALLKTKPEVCDFFDITFLPVDEYWDGAQGVYLPPVVFDSELPVLRKSLADIKQRGAKYALVTNISGIALAKEAGLTAIGDFRLNITNSAAREVYRKLGVERAILSPELTLPMARDVSGGVITYGRIPLMLTERCFMKENFGCEKCGNCSFTDRTGAKFPIIKEYGHRNLILNSRPTYMGDRRGELYSFSVTHEHLIFSVENAKEAVAVIDSYASSRSIAGEVRRIGKR